MFTEETEASPVPNFDAISWDNCPYCAAPVAWMGVRVSDHTISVSYLYPRGRVVEWCPMSGKTYWVGRCRID